MNIAISASAIAVASAVVLALPVAAADTVCQPEQFAEVVDSTGAYLRQFARTNQPTLQRKFEQLARQRRWPDQEASDRGFQLVQDQVTARLDGRARELVVELDRIDSNTGTDASCAKLERLKVVTAELRAVTRTKFEHMLARADAALGGTAAVAPPPAVAPQKPIIASAPQPRPVEPGTPTRPAAAKPAGPATPSPRWKTETQPAPRAQRAPETQATLQRPPGLPAPPSLPADRPPAPTEPTTYSVREIRDAGHGLFGNLSAGLASVIQNVFETYGEPNGYILGTEGGGAFLAGLSYGQGRFHTRMSAAVDVYWQGPTVGYDLGLQGSRVMILVYNIGQPENIFRRFAGIGGSAYVVGGVGGTYHQRGRVILAPIRTGLGLRLGANVGYLKFTPRPSINPF